MKSLIFSVLFVLLAIQQTQGHQGMVVNLGGEDDDGILTSGTVSKLG